MNQVTLLHQGNGAAGLSLGRHMADHRSCGSAGEASVRDQSNAASQLFIGRNSLGSIEHFRHTGALGALITDKHRVAGLNPVMKHRIDALLFTIKGTGP